MNTQMSEVNEGIRMKRKTLMARPEDSGFVVFTINDELNFDDVFAKVRQMLLNPKDKVWWDLNGITRTDFTATSVYILNNLVKNYQGSWPKGRVVIVADTALSYLISKTTLSLLRLDGFRGQAQLFSSREAALRWIELADLLR
jgi:hypothetical protein